MKKSNLYTGTGDRGTTSLVGGTRISKTDTRLEAYGTVDEFSATLALVLTHPQCPVEIADFLRHIQNTLFNLGAYLATDSPADNPATLYGLDDDDIQRIEANIDRLDSLTPPVNAFVLPGGTQLSAQAHLARTVCRRAERRIIALDQIQNVDTRVLRYMNRLSDYLFILSRYFNHIAGIKELIWQK